MADAITCPSGLPGRVLDPVRRSAEVREEERRGRRNVGPWIAPPRTETRSSAGAATAEFFIRSKSRCSHGDILPGEDGVQAPVLTRPDETENMSEPSAQRRRLPVDRARDAYAQRRLRADALRQHCALAREVREDRAEDRRAEADR